MSLIPTRKNIVLVERRLETAPRRTRFLGRFCRLIMFAVAFVFLHGVCLFAVSQTVRLNPGIIEDRQVVADLLCGEGATLTTDFRPEGKRRALSRWIVCRNAEGQISWERSQIAALLSGLVLSVPLGILLFGRRLVGVCSTSRLATSIPWRKRAATSERRRRDDTAS